MYNQRRRYSYDGKQFVETPQPLRYVGVSGKTKSALALTKEKGGNGKNVFLSVPAGSEVTVVANDNSSVDDNGQNPNYLVMTREGILGWAKIPQQPDGKTLIDTLYYRGD
jgi:hypothetical protein